MKIGAFARSHGVNPSTVRFYIDRALLTPRTENGRYVFNEVNDAQMEKILKYKRYRFSLEEIEFLFSYENLSNLKDDRIITEITNILENKKKLLMQEITALNTIMKDIDGEIESFGSLKKNITKNTYLPLGTLNLLCCPECGNDLHLENADIEPSGIKEATVKCACGYKVKIEDGILICPEHMDNSPFKVYENVDSIISMAKDFSPSFRRMVLKGYLRVYHQLLNSCNNLPGIMLIGPLSYNFILGYMRFIPKGATVIIVDVSLMKLQKMKTHLSDSGRDVLCIAGDISKTPIRKKVIDLFIDDYSFNNYGITYDRNLFIDITPFLKDNGIVVGQFIDYSKAPKSSKNIKTEYPECNMDWATLKRAYVSLAGAGLTIVERTTIGAPEGNNLDFVWQIDNEKLSLITYIARK